MHSEFGYVQRACKQTMLILLLMLTIEKTTAFCRIHRIPLIVVDKVILDSIVIGLNCCKC